MALVTESGSFTTNTSTGFQTVTLSNFTGISPKALLLWFEVDNGNERQGCIGIATSATNRRLICWASEDNQSVSDSTRRAETSILKRINSSLASDADAQLSSFGTNQFILNFTQAPATGFKVDYFAIGGSDLTNVLLVPWTCPAVTGAYDITGAGFTPTSAITIALDVTNTNSGNAASPMVSLWDGTNERTVVAQFRNGQATQDTRHTSSNDALLCMSPAGSERYKASFTAFNSDGAEVNFSTISSGKLIFTLFMKGGQVAVGTDQSPASAPTNVDSAIGFSGHSALYFSTGGSHVATNAANAGLMIGASDGTNHEATAFMDQDNVSTTNVTTDNSSSHSLIILDAAGNRDDSATTTFSGNNLRTAFDVADSTQRMFAYMAFGDDAAGGVTISGEIASVTPSIVEPTIRLSSVTVASEVAPIATSVQEPSIVLGSVTVGGEIASVTSSLVEPSVILGDVTVSGESMDLATSIIEPGITLGSVTVAAEIASLTATVVEPTISIGGDITVSGEIASTTTSIVDPQIILGDVTITGEIAGLNFGMVEPNIDVGGDITITGEIASVTTAIVDPTIVLSSVAVTGEIATVTASVVYSIAPISSLVAYTCYSESDYSVMPVPVVDRLVVIEGTDDVFEIQEDGSMYPDHVQMSPNELRWFRFDWAKFLQKDPAVPGDTIQSVQIFRLNQVKFSAGNGSTEPATNEIVLGVPSNGNGFLRRIETESGSWADGDAAGTMWLDPFTGWLATTDTSVTFQGGATATADVITAELQSGAAPVVGTDFVDVKLLGGTEDYDHEVLCRMTSVAGQVKDQTLTVEIRRPRATRVRKDPQDDLWYRWDFSDYLTNHFKFPGDTITGMATFTPSDPAGAGTPIAVGTEDTQTTYAQARVSGGTEDYDHEVAGLVSTANGVEVREKILVFEIRQD